jgi:hypothetical protein
MLDVLVEKRAEFGQNQPSVRVMGILREDTQVPDFVFQATSRHKF